MSGYVSRRKAIEEYLDVNSAISVIIIFSDGLSSDGGLVEAMKPLEIMPVKIIVRMCAVVRDVNRLMPRLTSTEAGVEAESKAEVELEVEVETVVENDPEAEVE